MDQILEQVDWTADDIAIYAKDEKEHDQVLHNLLRVGKESGLVFNSVKCSIKTDSVTVFGVKNDASGVHPDPEKVSSGSTQHGNTHQQEGTADAVPQLGSSSTGRLS